MNKHQNCISFWCLLFDHRYVKSTSVVMPFTPKQLPRFITIQLHTCCLCYTGLLTSEINLIMRTKQYNLSDIIEHYSLYFPGVLRDQTALLHVSNAKAQLNNTVCINYYQVCKMNCLYCLYDLTKAYLPTYIYLHI